MDVAILGGTGDIGEGLAVRLLRDTDHDVVVGSREADRGAASAEEYRARLGDAIGDGSVTGATNCEAAGRCSVIVLAVPPYYLSNTIEAIGDDLVAGDVLVSPAVGMDRDETGFHYDRPGVGSVAELVDSYAPETVAIVGAFQNLAAGALSDLSSDLGYDVVVTGDDSDAKTVIMELVEEIRGLRALDGGSLANSAKVESITPLFVNLATKNDDMHDLGIRFD
jgi:NADPH-dependent F420 reductase